MDGSNLLSGGVDQLNEIKENLLELRGYQSKNDSLVTEEEKLEKSIESLEKAIAEEVQTTIRKRRQEIEDAFEKQVDKTRAQMKKIREKRDKRKDRKVSERMNTETASLKVENNQLHLEAKSILKQKHIPSFCNTKLYYALYSPSCFTDFLVVLAVIMVTLLLIPCGIYFYLLPEEKILYLILTYICTVLLFGGCYILVGNRTKEKYTEEILQVKRLRSSIRVNKKKIKVIKNNIKRDRDESAYGLQNFDADLAKLEQEVVDIDLQKKGALATFDTATSQIIATEIHGMSAEKLSALKTGFEKANMEANKAGERIKALTIKIASEYEPFIGKDLISLERMETLINIIQAGSANTISEAVAFYRQSMNGTTTIV